MGTRLLGASKPGGSPEQGGLLPVGYGSFEPIAGPNGSTCLHIFAGEVGMWPLAQPSSERHPVSLLTPASPLRKYSLSHHPGSSHGGVKTGIGLKVFP